MKKELQQYWRSNLKILTALLLVWFSVSFLCGIVFVDTLNKVQFGGFKLGFWFAQQGSIYVFLFLIFIYVMLMNRLDKKYDVDEK
jgi:putative solute:sodium symporter small subunit